MLMLWIDLTKLSWWFTIRTLKRPISTEHSNKKIGPFALNGISRVDLASGISNKKRFWTCNKKLNFLDQNGDMFYSVLWLPPRYKVLCLYLLLIPVVIGLIAIDKGTVFPNFPVRLDSPSAAVHRRRSKNKLDIQ